MSMVPMEGATLPPSIAMIEDRLVEAMITCWRAPDREAGWQRIRAAWPEMRRHTWFGDYDDRGGDGASARELRPASQTRREIAEMEEAFGWAMALSNEDRRLVGLAVTQLARGQRQISWKRMLRPMGLIRGADGLRMRYGRALATMANAQSRGNPRETPSTPTISR